MTSAGSQLQGRDFLQLLRAMQELLSNLAGDGGEEKALQASFEAVAQGLGAQKALLLLVEEAEPLRLRSVVALGGLTADQVKACERGESVKGVSPSLIRQVVTSGRAELVEDPRLASDASRTPALAASDFSVLCAPIPDLARGGVLAVVYLQNASPLNSYGKSDLAWLTGYTAAAGQVFGYYFRKEQQTRELRAELVARSAADDAPEILGNSPHTRGSCVHCTRC